MLENSTLTFLRPSEAEAFLAEHGCHVSRRTLAKWRCLGGGPRFRKAGNRIVYERSELRMWADARLSQPRVSTSDVEEARHG